MILVEKQDAESSDSESEGFMTPLKQSLSPFQTSNITDEKAGILGEILSGEFDRRVQYLKSVTNEVLSPDLAGDDFKSAKEIALFPPQSVSAFSPEFCRDGESFPWRDVDSPRSQKESEHSKRDETEDLLLATVVQMEVEIKLPTVAIELNYDVTAGSHLILELKKLEATTLFRAYDRHLHFDLSELSIQDSFRSEEQSYLTWTPVEFGNLIHISYVNIFSSKSPLYSKYGTEVDIDFAHLCLNIDVNTLLHLKPFFDVLLGKARSSSGSSSGSNESLSTTNEPFLYVSSHNGLSNLPFSPSLLRTASEDCPSGMLITAKLSKISLDLLRCPEIEKKGLLLDPAFSIEVANLTADVKMAELMEVTVQLKSFQIRDIRVVSEDYFYRTIILPTAEDTSGFPSTYSGANLHTSDGSSAYETASSAWTSAAAASVIPQSHLLYLHYYQRSKNDSHLDVEVSNVTSFVSLEAVLDFLAISSSNFFTLLSLFSGKKWSDNSLNRSRSQAQSSIDATDVSASTMNTVFNVNTPRIILLEDPYSRESKAIVCRCGIIARYSRETVDNAIISTKEITEALHVTLHEVEVFVINSMSEWTQKYVLRPVDIEFHLKRRTLNSILQSSHMVVDMDIVDARLSFHDLVLASTILSRRALIEPTSNRSSMKNSVKEESRKKSHVYGRVNSASIDDDTILKNQRVPTISYRFNLSSLALVTVNDFDGQNVPVLKMSTEECTIYYEQEKISQGEGSADIKLDFYNPKLNQWEPLLERWLPTLKIHSKEGVVLLDISSQQTLQITVSGIMLESLMRSYSLFFQQYRNEKDSQSYSQNSSIVLSSDSSPSDIEVHNLLGDDIGIELRDCATDLVLLSIPPRENGGNGIGTFKANRQSLTVSGSDKSLNNKGQKSEKDHKKRIASSFFAEARLTSVNLHFLGNLQDERAPLLHVPLNLSKPRAFRISPLKSNVGSDISGNGTDASLYDRLSKEIPILLEPVVEEVFQNSRYDPLVGQWKVPYLFGDLFEWTDATGTIRKDLSSIDISSFRTSRKIYIYFFE